MGSATVRLLYNVGAFVIFGDLATSAAEALMASLNHPARVTFVLADTSSYSANMTLFRVAHQKYGRVDHAIACAGISEQGKWFDPMLTIESVAVEPTTKVLNVNLKGRLFFARIAVVFLREGKGSEDRSLTLLSSVAGFRESPGLTIYQVSDSPASNATMIETADFEN
jgi:NAD(P)-dependent dehydrogenase (short-subunit alcohol dehydrogenase family)